MIFCNDFFSQIFNTLRVRGISIFCDFIKSWCRWLCEWDLVNCMTKILWDFVKIVLRWLIFDWFFNFFGLINLRLYIEPFNMSTNLVIDWLEFYVILIHFFSVKKDFFVNFMMSIKFISIYIQISPKESINKLNSFWIIVSFFGKF